jgi:hypothetical protein
MKLLIMQFSPTSCHFVSLRSKYSYSCKSFTVPYNYKEQNDKKILKQLFIKRDGSLSDYRH